MKRRWAGWALVLAAVLTACGHAAAPDGPAEATIAAGQAASRLPEAELPLEDAPAAPAEDTPAVTDAALLDLVVPLEIALAHHGGFAFAQAAELSDAQLFLAAVTLAAPEQREAAWDAAGRQYRFSREAVFEILEVHFRDVAYTPPQANPMVTDAADGTTTVSQFSLPQGNRYPQVLEREHLGGSRMRFAVGYYDGPDCADAPYLVKDYTVELRENGCVYEAAVVREERLWPDDGGTGQSPEEMPDDEALISRILNMEVARPANGFTFHNPCELTGQDLYALFLVTADDNLLERCRRDDGRYVFPRETIETQLSRYFREAAVDLSRVYGYDAALDAVVTDNPSGFGGGPAEVRVTEKTVQGRFITVTLAMYDGTSDAPYRVKTYGLEADGENLWFWFAQ